MFLSNRENLAYPSALAHLFDLKRALLRLAVAASFAAISLGAGGCAVDSGDGEGDSDDEEQEAVERSSEALFGSDDPAPKCVAVTKNDREGFIVITKQTIAIKNNCTKTLKVTLDLSGKADPDCVVLKPGTTSTWTWKSAVSMRKVKLCK